MYKKLTDKFLSWQVKTRMRLFGPVIDLLIKCKVTPNAITHARILLVFVFIALYWHYPRTAVIIFTISMFSDMLDGMIARRSHSFSDRGKFMDLIADHFTYLVMLVSFLSLRVSPVLLFIATIVHVFATILTIVQTNEHKTTDWIIHPRLNHPEIMLLPVIAFYLFHFFGINLATLSIQISLGIASILLIYKYIHFSRA